MSTRIAAGALILVAGLSAAQGQDAASFETPEYMSNWGLGAIDASTAYAAGWTGAGTTIAIIDGGFDLAHPEFAGKIVDQQDTAGGGGAVPVDIHGTHVAGIAGAARNGMGMHGVAFDANLAFYTYGGGALAQAAAFNAAAAQGAVAINNSYGIDVAFTEIRNQASFATDPYQALADRLGLTADHWRAEAQAMRNAQQQGVIVWAVANVQLSEIDISAAMPLILPHLGGAWLAVVNVDQTNTLQSMRCGSGMFFCLAAPGTNINSTVPGGGYASFTGTSMASPHVSGAVAIARQMFPNASTEELASIVLQTATDLGASGIDSQFGWGLLNLGNLSATLDAETAALYSAASWGKLSTMRAVSDSLRVRWFGDAAAGEASLLSAYAPTSQFDDPFEALEPERRDVWISAFGDFASLEAGPAAPAYENRVGGMLAGLTFHETDSLRLGGAIGLSNSHLDSIGGADSASATGLHAALLADWEAGDWFARSTAQLAYFHHDYLRTTISGASGVSVAPAGTASAGSFGAGLDLEFGRSLASGASVFEPYAALVGRSNSSGSFSEAGSGAFALSVDDQSVSQLDLGGGIRWRWEDPEPEGTQLGLMFDLAYFRLAGDNAHSVDATLLGTPISASTAGVGRDIIRVGAEFRLTDTDLNWSASARYGGSLQGGAQSHSLSAQFNAKF